MPQISVIVPVYKVEPYLHRCVDSILSQTFKDFELILVDDGSPDNCPAICDEYAKKDNRVIIIHQENGGLSAARNAGIDWAFANSNSEWITFIDSDDWVHPQYLDLLYNTAIDSNVKISMCIITPIYESLLKYGKIEYTYKKVQNKKAYNIYDNKFYAYSCGKLFHKELLNSIRFPNGKLFEDWHTTYKLIFATSYVSIVDGDLYFYFQHDNTITQSEWNVSKADILGALQEQIYFFDEISEIDLARIAKFNFIKLVYNHYYEAIRSKSSEAQNLSKELRKVMRRALNKYRKLFSITIHTNPEYYECAFPIFMWFYYRIVAIIKRIKQ